MKEMIFFVIVSLNHFSLWALQPSQKAYYGVNFESSISTATTDKDLKDILQKILKSSHVKTNDADEIVTSCTGKSGCTQQIVYGYDRARKFLFGNFYLVPLQPSGYGIKEMYCDRIYYGTDFKGSAQPGLNVVPSATIINVEHTWPQSKFSGRYPKEMQKSDLHHLFPTDSTMNSLRGNNIFGEVDREDKRPKCTTSKYGTGTAGGVKIFEPPDNHKGHVARALFYFSVRYEMAMSPQEEVIMKKWNREHPVDEEEMARNDVIQKIQMNRNPFIDYPELADRINDF